MTRHVLLLAVLASVADARPPDALLGPLADLAAPRSGTPRHESSTDPHGGNVDFRSVAPGQSLTLFAHDGAGVVHRFWMTFFPREPKLHRQLLLRMYWDGEDSPSVEVPVGDFFGVGFGEYRDYASLPLAETSGGYDCYWPMPFHRSARWTLTNVSDVPALVWFNVDYTADVRLGRQVRHFHAQWRRENPTTPSVSYTILEAAGHGHFVGAALFMRNRQPEAPTFFGPFGFLEGDEMIFVDDESKPVITGTGSEDYFLGSWDFGGRDGAIPFGHAMYGAPLIVNAERTGGRYCCYRWHGDNPVTFERYLKHTMEHGHANDRGDNFFSAAYWYQTTPFTDFPALPPLAQRIPVVKTQ